MSKKYTECSAYIKSKIVSFRKKLRTALKSREKSVSKMFPTYLVGSQTIIII